MSCFEKSTLFREVERERNVKRGRCNNGFITLKILTSQQRENMSKMSVVISQEDSHNSFSLSCCCFFEKAPLIAQRHSLNYEIYTLINQNALQLWWHRMPFSSRFRVFIIVGATSTTSQRSSSASRRCYGSLDLINCWVENLFILFQP